MAWAYAQLKAAIVALPAGTADIAAAINAQTVASDILAGSVFAIITPTGEAFNISQMAKLAPSGAVPATQKDQVIGVAWSFMDILGRFVSVQVTNPSVWTSVQNSLAALVAAGLLSPASSSAIQGLRLQPMWAPTVTASNVNIAQAPVAWSYTVQSAVKDPSNANIIVTAGFTNKATGETATRQTWGDTINNASIAAWAAGIINSFIARDAATAAITLG